MTSYAMIHPRKISTVANERLREIAAYQPLDFAITHDELVSMASELIAKREASKLRGTTEAHKE